MRLTAGTRVLILIAVVTAVMIGIGQFLPEHVASLFGDLGSDVRNALYRPYFHIGNVPVTAFFLLKSFLFLIVLRFLGRASRRLMLNQVLSRTSLEPGQKYALAQITGYLVALVWLLIGLEWVGLNMGSLVLLTERPVQVGDRVEVGGINGDVVRIGARSTWVRTNDNVVIIIPNSEFINNRVTNWTANDRQVRFNIPLGVSYGSDPERVREVLLEVARDHPDVLKDPAPEILFAGFGDSSLDFELRVWTVTRVQTPRPLAPAEDLPTVFALGHFSSTREIRRMISRALS
jgi:small-conductance mechanosensitive channel